MTILQHQNLPVLFLCRRRGSMAHGTSWPPAPACPPLGVGRAPWLGPSGCTQYIHSGISPWGTTLTFRWFDIFQVVRAGSQSLLNLLPVFMNIKDEYIQCKLNNLDSNKSLKRVCFTKWNEAWYLDLCRSTPEDPKTFVWKYRKWPPWKTSSMKDNLNGWWPQWKMTQNKRDPMEYDLNKDDLDGLQPQWEMNLMEDNLNGRLP